MRTIKLIVLFVLVAYSSVAQQAVPRVTLTDGEKTLNTQWQGKRVAFLGDSMTDERRGKITFIYWQYLSELMGIVPSVYGISGNQWDGIYKQALKLTAEKNTAIDAIFIFAGTNDFSHGTPMGSFYSETTKETNHNGSIVVRKYRSLPENDSTFCGRINKVMSYLKEHFPQQQIVIMTPIHRGFARFSDKNVQPEENFANAQNLYIEDYVDALRKAASVWSVPLIDLYSLSGLYPLADSHAQYFSDKDSDRLHPNSVGNYRLAKTIQYQMLTIPSGFAESATK